MQITSELLELLDRHGLEYRTLNEIDRLSSDHFNQFLPDTSEHASFSLIALAAHQLALQVNECRGDKAALRFLESRYLALFRDAIASLDLEKLQRLLSQIQESSGHA
jgi:hypothetical protein